MIRDDRKTSNNFCLNNRQFVMCSVSEKVNKPRHGLLGKHNLFPNRKTWTRIGALCCYPDHNEPTISNENSENKEENITLMFEEKTRESQYLSPGFAKLRNHNFYYI
uniref:Uncharacterized protein n=1 Tax=Glossina austeni TaxID=7395 RepID=A0A1A9VF76_GLOAU